VNGLYRAFASVVFGCTLLCQAVYAGRSCAEPQPLKTETVVRALNLAVQTVKLLDSSGAQVVVLGRAGQDLTKYGLHYSHLGFAYQQADGQGGHVWRILHKLNQCGSADSAIYRQGLGQFFLDDLWRFEAAWVVPTPEVQRKLLAVLSDEQRSVQMHIKPYSMVSYVWGLKYQQSNQWAIETMAWALDPDMVGADASRIKAQKWLLNHDYQPGILNIGAFTRLGARMTAANVAFDDHPNEKRFSDRIETVTVDSVFAWLQRAGLTTQVIQTIH
jgi:hypothetical protein